MENKKEVDYRKIKTNFMPSKLIGAYKKRVILDTDMGWDDVISLSLLTKNQNIEIVGVTVVGMGETHLQEGCELAKRILKAANLGDVPVIKGVEKGMHKFPKEFKTYMDNNCYSSVLKEIKLTDSEKNFNEGAAKWIKEELDHTENQITIISLGGLSNIAKLYQIEDFVKFENIERIVIMGGAIDVDGNVSFLNNLSLPVGPKGEHVDMNQGKEYSSNNAAEWNIFLDPQAAEIVFKNEKNVPLVLVPLDVTAYCTLDKEISKLITSNDIISRLIADVLKREMANEGSLPIFDPLATMAAFETLRSLRYEKRRIEVCTEETKIDNYCGKTYGLEPNLELPEEKYFQNVSVVKSVSEKEFKTMFTLFANLPSRYISNENGKIEKKNVAILCFDDCELFDFAGVFEVFGSARSFNKEKKSYMDGNPLFNVYAVKATKEEKLKDKNVKLNSGPALLQNRFPESNVTMKAKYLISEEINKKDKPDVIVVIGGQGIDDLLENESFKQKTIKWIQKYGRKSDYNIGVCSGAVLLAHSELLNGLEVTTHHSRFEQLSNLSEKNGWNLTVVDSRNGRNFVHNPCSKNMTSGGVHCSIAGALHIVELYFGPKQKEFIANDVMEYSIPSGDYSIPKEMKGDYPFIEDPRLFIKGFSHLNVIVPNLQEMERSTEFYFRVLGFQEAWSVWLKDMSCKRFARDAGFTKDEDVKNVKLLVRFLVHPNVPIHIELMMYKNLSKDSIGKDKPTFFKTNDAGGCRHIALEVSDSKKVWRFLKKQSDVKLLNKKFPPQVLAPDPQTFFYFIDINGVQWEMEQGRNCAKVIPGCIN